MFDVGWTEIVVIAVVAIIVVGPKELPAMLRAFGKTLGQVRKMGGEFQRQFDQALKEAELDGVQRQINEVKSFKPLDDARKAMMDAQKSVTKAIDATETEAKLPEPSIKAEAQKADKPADVNADAAKAETAQAAPALDARP